MFTEEGQPKMRIAGAEAWIEFENAEFQFGVTVRPRPILSGQNTGLSCFFSSVHARYFVVKTRGCRLFFGIAPGLVCGLCSWANALLCLNAGERETRLLRIETKRPVCLNLIVLHITMGGSCCRMTAGCGPWSHPVCLIQLMFCIRVDGAVGSRGGGGLLAPRVSNPSPVPHQDGYVVLQDDGGVERGGTDETRFPLKIQVQPHMRELYALMS